MLCYHNLPGAYATVAGRQVHGFQTGHPPSHFTHEQYCANKGSLIQAPFTPSYLEDKVKNGPFPYRAYFTLDLIKTLDYRILQQIASYLGVDALLPRTRLIYSVRNALKDL
jgi:hypothetical protein